MYRVHIRIARQTAIGPTHRQFHGAADASVTPPIGQSQMEGDETLGRPLAPEQEKLILDADRSLQMIGAPSGRSNSAAAMLWNQLHRPKNISGRRSARSADLPAGGERAIRPRRGGGCWEGNPKPFLRRPPPRPSPLFALLPISDRGATMSFACHQLASLQGLVEGHCEGRCPEWLSSHADRPAPMQSSFWDLISDE